MGPPNAERARTGPTGDLGRAVAETFGDFDGFKEQFSTAAQTLFGSGFVYLVRDRQSFGRLAIKQYANQDTPVMDDELPVVGLDVWEHAYYKKYGPARKDYIEAWFTVVNWDLVSRNYHASPSSGGESS